MLDEVLKGILRAPALLLENPTQELASLNLEKYLIVASEPLHDIKGHLINLIAEMPNILKDETKSKCTHLIDNCIAKDKKSGADMRRVAIQLLLLLLKDIHCSRDIIFLLQSIIKIGEIAYSRDDKRCPRQLLQLYNMCWMHMELCKKLFKEPKMSMSKMFGHYLHALTAHLPTQLELVCLRSLNTEEYNALVAKFKPKVMLVESERAAKLKQLERQHFQEHGNLPTKTKGSQYSNLLKERNVAKAILRAM